MMEKLTLFFLAILFFGARSEAQTQHFFNMLLTRPKLTCSPVSIEMMGAKAPIYGEGDTGAQFTIQLSGPACVDMKVAYGVAGTAESGVHYSGALSGVATIPQGATSVSVSYDVLNNAVAEDKEKRLSFYLQGAIASGPQVVTSSVSNTSLVHTYLDNDQPYRSIEKVDLGQGYGCAKDEHQHVYCWGLGTSGQLARGVNMSSEKPKKIYSLSHDFNMLVSNYYFSCALSNSSELFCWGYNGVGNLGLGDANSRGAPDVVDPGVSYSFIALGGDTACGITSAGILKCWGFNSVGQVGRGNFGGYVAAPTVIDSGTLYSKVFVGDQQNSNSTNVCGITTAGVLKCWGSNSYGQLGNNDMLDQSSPQVIDPGETYSKISLSVYSTCGITTSGVLKCWGYNVAGVLGVDSSGSGSYYVLTPGIVDGGISYSDVVVRDGFACGITTAGVLKCWGTSSAGQFANGVANTTATLPEVVDPGQSYKKMSLGDYNVCGITSADVLKCWGYNNSGTVGDNTVVDKFTPTVIDAGTFYADVYLDYLNSCGITTSGVVKCWGYNYFGAVGDNTTIDRRVPTTIDAGSSYLMLTNTDNRICGVLADGKIKCWGNSPHAMGLDGITQTLVPTTLGSGPSQFLKISAGDMHACAVSTDEDLYCWGASYAGALGSGSNFHSVPKLIDEGVKYADVYAGRDATCAVTTAGVLKCWGYNAYGTLGDGTRTDVFYPKVINSGTSYRKVSVSYLHSCGITTAGVLKCWGFNGSNNLGDGTTTDRLTPKIIDTGVSYDEVVVGYTHTCGITSSGDVKCWGDDSYGALGNDLSGSSATPMLIDAGEKYSKLSSYSSAYRTCGVTTAGILKCWGENLYQGIGVAGLDGFVLSPVAVDPGVTYADAVVGSYGSCGVTTTGLVKCWGFDYENGVLGSSPNEVMSATGAFEKPVVVDSGKTYQQITSSGSHTCALSSVDKSFMCWGSNGNNQIDASLGNVFTPKIVESRPYSMLSAGSSHTCGITTLGRVRCLGNNSNGQLGDASIVQKSIPTTVNDAATYKYISAGGIHTCGITTDGNVKCWGLNTNGRLGDGTGSQRTSPVAINDVSLYSAVSAGGSHSCGLLDGGLVKCWGLNASGQLGDNTLSQRTSPVAINGGLTYTAISSGDAHTCGVTSSGALRCWGQNNNGQLGDGSFVDRKVPVAVDAGTTYTQVAAGVSHSCGLTVAGVLKCWGYNGQAQFGVPAVELANSATPVVVDPGQLYSSVAVGNSHTCGITITGTVKCWGTSSLGQSGIGYLPGVPILFRGLGFE